MLKIGITAGIFPPDLTRNIYSKKYISYIESDLASYWLSFNAIPILIPKLPKNKLPLILEQLDGLCLQGGTDIAPNRYGEEVLNNWNGDSIRDHYEWEIVDWFINKNKPVIGFCRGLQFLNVYFGGTLFQDIPSQTNHKEIHRDYDAYDQHTHIIQLNKKVFWEKIGISQDIGLVNSLHHQGIKKLGSDLEVLATSVDGLIEAFYWKKVSPGKVMGVQWHPEFDRHSTKKLLPTNKIIEHFLSHC